MEEKEQYRMVSQKKEETVFKIKKKKMFSRAPGYLKHVNIEKQTREMANKKSKETNTQSYDIIKE